MTTPKRKTTKAPKKATKAPKAAPRKKAAVPSQTEQLLKLVVQALDAKKAEALCVLDVSQQSSITDYLILANGNSEPHLRALRVEL